MAVHPATILLSAACAAGLTFRRCAAHDSVLKQPWEKPTMPSEQHIRSAGCVQDTKAHMKCRTRETRAGRNGPPRHATQRETTARRRFVRDLRTKAVRWFGGSFYACGYEGLPKALDCRGEPYVLSDVLKHDFLAGTGVYEAVTSNARAPRRLVCKIARRRPFCLIPLGWLGRLVTHNEVCNLRRCEGIDGVPKVLDRISPHIYGYAYIEGACLSEDVDLPLDFFEQLLGVLERIHARRLVHFDLHKPGNILVGHDGRPHIIDFQLSTYIPDWLLVSGRLSSRLRRSLQAYDLYHLYKHKRTFLPGRLTEAERQLAQHRGVLLRMHRAIANPYKRVRRACLRYLHIRGILKDTEDVRASAETDPTRWTGQPHAEPPNIKSVGHPRPAQGAHQEPSRHTPAT